MSKKAAETLELALDSLIKEVEICGQSGGFGRSVGFAQQIVNLNQAIEIINTREGKKFADKMAEARAAKKS